jgi:hypothetical protein
MEIEINYWAVLLSAVASMVVGFIYYGSPIGKKWAALKGYTPESLKAEQSKMGKYYGLSFILALLTGYVLAHIMSLSEAFFGNPPIQTGLSSAFFVWLGFVMPVQATQQIFGEKNFQLFLIDTGYQLISVLAMGVIIGWMN